jgi:hypothetical protein
MLVLDARKAKAALMYTDEKPGRLGEWYWYEGETEPSPNVPIISTNRLAARQLQELLADGPVELDIRAITPTPFVYDLLVPAAGRIPAAPSIRAKTSQFARLDVQFGAHVPLEDTSEARMGMTPMHAQASADDTGFSAPRRRTDYVLANEVQWSQSVLPYNQDENALVDSSEVSGRYRPGQHELVRWFHPAATHSLPDDPTSWYEVTRTGTEFAAHISAFTDQANRVSDAYDAQHRIRLYQDERLLAEGESNGIWTVVPAGAARYRLELDSARSLDWRKYSTKLSSVWTIHSTGTPGEERLPLLLVDYDLPTADPFNQVRAGDLVPIELTIRHQAGAPTTARPKALTLAQSYDDGATWQPVTLVRTSEGKYLALVRHAKSQADRAVSLRVDASDADGNRLVQTVTKAYGVR